MATNSDPNPFKLIPSNTDSSKKQTITTTLPFPFTSKHSPTNFRGPRASWACQLVYPGTMSPMPWTRLRKETGSNH